MTTDHQKVRRFRPGETATVCAQTTAQTTRLKFSLLQSDAERISQYAAARGESVSRFVSALTMDGWQRYQQQHPDVQLGERLCPTL